jgi:ribonuclease P protein component
MTRSADFAAVLRGGRRAGTGGGTVVLHQRLDLHPGGAPVVGLVVGRTVGNSVVRHRVSRRLRAALAERLDRLAPGSATVVRALPRAGAAPSHALRHDLDRTLDQLAARSAIRGSSS